jgi:thioredoxin reductase
MDRAALDTLIVGGGPAGLAAALVLGRCLRNVLVCDTGTQRNRASRKIHAMPGQEGRAPSAFLDDVRQELCRYPTIRLRDTEVEHVSPNGGDFDFRCADGMTGTASTVLFATGLVDTLPTIPGIETFYGSSVHHCVYCDGAEYEGRPLVAYGVGDKGAGLALMLSHWSADVVACCEETAPSAELEKRLADRQIPIITSRVTELMGAGSKLEAVIFENGMSHACNALFFSTGCTQGSKLVDQLGCLRDERGTIMTDPLTEETTVHGVYVAGDASRDVLLVAVAVGEGAKAGVAINRALLKADGLL